MAYLSQKLTYSIHPCDFGFIRITHIFITQTHNIVMATLVSD